MKKIIFITVLAVTMLSCKDKTKPSSKIHNTDIENLIPGPIANESLSKEQLDHIKFIQETFNEVYPISLEETITNFKRDQNPNSEINIWLNMAKTFQSFTKENKGKEKLEVRKEAFKLILMRSMMPEDDAVNNSELKLLNDHEIQKILKNYTLEAKPIKVENK